MAWPSWPKRLITEAVNISNMKAFCILLLAANVLVFGLGSGWFGHPRSEIGRSPAMLSSQLNAQALTVSPGQLQAR